MEESETKLPMLTVEVRLIDREWMRRMAHACDHGDGVSFFFSSLSFAMVM